MNLLQALPKDWDNKILLSPGGEVNGEYVDGSVSPEWFQTNFPTLASATVPLTSEQFTELKAIDNYWSMNADKWREQGII